MIRDRTDGSELFDYLEVDAELDTSLFFFYFSINSCIVEEPIECQESAELLEDCISLISCTAGDYFPMAPLPHEINVTALELDTICSS
jgi:hypothetical protein